MPKLSTDRLFPYCILEGAEVWDGTTYFETPGALPYPITMRESPSNSSSEQTLVIGPGTPYPIALSLDEAMAWYWRVKYMKMSWTFQEKAYTSSYLDETYYIWDSPGTLAAARSLSASDYSSLFPDDESPWSPNPSMDRASGSSFTFSAGTTQSGNELSLPCSHPKSLWIDDADTGGNPTESVVSLEASIVLYEGEYYPKLSVHVAASDYTAQNKPQLSSIALREADIIPPIPPVLLSGSTIFGKTLPMYGGGDPTGSKMATGSLADWSEVVSGTVTIEAHEYFPYDPDDEGGPVWNTSTGAQLRDPFSIQP